MKPRYKRTRDLRVNERIRIPQIRLIGHDGKQLGIVSPREGLRMAYEKGLDLVEIVPSARPPVCRIMDYGKYKYEQSKSEKHKHKAILTKEIKLRLKTQEADIEVKLRHAREFLSRGHKVMVKLQFKGREIIYSRRGRDTLANFAKSLDSIGVIEQPLKIVGKTASVLLTPKIQPKKGVSQNSVEEKNAQNKNP